METLDNKIETLNRKIKDAKDTIEKLNLKIIELDDLRSKQLEILENLIRERQKLLTKSSQNFF